MGRPELAVDQTVPELAEVAEFLRAQRRAAGMTYRQLARKTRVSEATLKRAASGKVLPRHVAMVEYLTACSASPWQRETADELWRTAKRALDAPQGAAPRPDFIRDPADLSGALRDLHRWAGSPSLRTMERRAGGFGELPHSTAHRIIRGKTVPHTEQQMVAFLRACEVPTANHVAWLAAWHKAMTTRLRKDPVAALLSDYMRAVSTPRRSVPVPVPRAAIHPHTGIPTTRPGRRRPRRAVPATHP